MITRFVCCLALAVFASLAGAEEPKPAPPSAPHTSGTPMEFDSFILVLLVRAPNAPDLPKEELDKLQQGHLDNMKRLAGEGKLFKAGPTEDFSGRNVRGILIFKTESLDQAKEWVATDPSVKAGRLVPEFMKWYVQKGTLK
jgi:uncharacterized protein YciI